MTLPSGEVRTYTYDPVTGQLRSITSSDATVSFTYDGLLPTSEAWSGTGLTAGTVLRGYNDDFQATSLQVAAEPAVTFGYDLDGLLTQAGSLSMGRDPGNGLLTGTTIDDGTGNEVTDSRSYSQFGEPAVYGASYNSTELYFASYSRDKLGRITSKVERVEGLSTGTASYEYL